MIFPRAILFDLDGTLIDSAPDIAAAVNELLAGRGLPEQSLDAVTKMIGDGMPTLVERAFRAAGQSLEGAALKQAQTDMMPIYMRHTTQLTTVYPGVRETLDALKARSRVKMAVVTNKPQAATVAVLDHFGLTSYFDAIVGGDAVENRKPAPDALFLALDQLGVPAEIAAMVGDSEADIAAGNAAGVMAVLVLGGYLKSPSRELHTRGLYPDLVIRNMAELPARLAGVVAGDCFRWHP